jgi:hypothetical protein
LVIFEDQVLEENNETFVWLNRHSFVYHLDSREEGIHKQLISLVKNKTRDHEGWVPKPVVYAEMNRNMAFGYSRQEQEYWLDTAIWRQILIQEKKVDRGKEQYYLKVNPSLK